MWSLGVTFFLCNPVIKHATYAESRYGDRHMPFWEGQAEEEGCTALPQLMIFSVFWGELSSFTRLMVFCELIPDITATMRSKKNLPPKLIIKMIDSFLSKHMTFSIEIIKSWCNGC